MLVAHYSVTQKEFDKLLALRTIKQTICDVCVYSSVLMLKHIGGLNPIINCKQFNCFTHKSTFKMPIVKQVWWLIHQGDHHIFY